MSSAIPAIENKRAWGIAWTLGWTELISWGIIYYAFSVLLVPMQEELGWSAGLITGAFSLALLVSGLIAPWVGRWIDRHGARGLMTIGSVLGTLLIVAWSEVQSWPVLYLIWCGLGIAMALTLYEPAFATIAPWFDGNRGRALLIISFLGGLASTVFLPLTGWLEVEFGWRDALLILAAILAVTTIVPHAVALRPPTKTVYPLYVQQASTSAALLKDVWFQRISISFFLQMFTIAGASVHLIAYLLEKGISPTTAAWIAGTIGIAQTDARVVVTMFEKKFAPEHVTFAMFILQAASIVLLVLAPGSAAVFIAVLMLGFGRGAFTLLRPAIVLKHYRVQESGAVNGTLSFVLTFASTLAPVLTGIAVGALGAYPYIFAFYGVLFLLGGVALWSTRFVSAPNHVMHHNQDTNIETESRRLGSK